MIVFVRDNNVEQAMRVLKRKLMREGTLRELKRRRFYEKPSEQATRARGMAVRRLRKTLRKQLIADGALPAPKKKVSPPAPPSRTTA
jgi:small subunit ribosomal protein S21